VIDFTDLVQKAQAGDMTAYGILYTELYTPVFKYVFTRTRDKELAEDITGDVFVRFLSSLHLYKTQKDSPLHYLFTIARNLLINNSKKKRPFLFEEGIEENIPSDERSQIEKQILSEDTLLVLHALEQIQRDQREVLELKFLSELSTKEVAHMLRKTEANVRQLESRGLKKLREYILHNE
jgi:RNA polymerase sigma-70 factor (ECF subfamily)